MSSDNVGAVFFDIGDTLASVGLDASGRVIERMEVLEGVTGALGGLRGRGFRLGVISDRGPVEEAEVLRALREAGLLDFFDPRIIVFGPKKSTEIFRRAARLARLASGRCMFVGENEAERDFASQAGMRVAEDPRAAAEALGGAG